MWTCRRNSFNKLYTNTSSGAQKALEEEMEHMFNDEMMPGDDGAGHNPFPPSAPGERPPECDQQN